MSDIDDNDERIEGIEQLARRKAPQRDLWPGIESRLAPRRTRSRRALVQLAVAASVVAGLAGIFGLQLERAPTGGVVTPAANPAGTTEVVSATPNPLAADSRAIVKANLAIVRSAEKQLRQALAQDPESPALRDLLASTENRGRSLRALL